MNHLGQEDFIGNEKADDLTIGEVIGKGTYGIVYRGTYHEKLVAVKVMVIQDSDYSQPQVMDQIIGDFTVQNSSPRSLLLIHAASTIVYLGRLRSRSRRC